MVKLTGPALAHQASGTVAGELTFSNWKGRPYLKMKSQPDQPRTSGQISIRAMMEFLSKQWNNLQAAQQATWDALATATEISAFNAYQSENLTRWARRAPPTKAHPAAEENALPAAQVITATGGPRHVDVQARLFGPVNDNWTMLLFHSEAADPAPTVDNLIHVFALSDLDPIIWTHTPLAAGTHYYKAVPTTDDGNVDWTKFTNTNAVVT